MKKISSVDDTWTYLSRLGFGGGRGPGWIPEAQRIYALVGDALLAASGQSTWYHKTFKPFKVEFHRNGSSDNPWAGAFLVVNADGKVTTLEMRNVKTR